ncbi:MAG: XTP/dITP diphosphatase [Nitrospirae bacterium]|nr:XTP/dITP diphosphatase [Nitrospirota bacterium]
MLKIVIATRNSGKIAEIQSIINNSDIKNVVEVETLLSYPDIPEIIEDGNNFSENAAKKALTVAKFTGQVSIADDSGLEVDALGGAPGVYSARFAGEKAADSDNIKKLMSLLKDVPPGKRGARFVCVIAIATPAGEVSIAEGECPGIIAEKARGTSGFGYDPVFVVPQYEKTFAELGSDIKNRISHRAAALGNVYNILAGMVRQKC